MPKRKQAVETPEIRVHDSVLYSEIKALSSFIYNIEDNAISPETESMLELAKQRIKDATVSILKNIQPDECGERRCFLCSEQPYSKDEPIQLILSRYGVLEIDYLELIVEPLEQPSAAVVSKEQRAVSYLRKALQQNVETIITLIRNENEFGYGETYYACGLLSEFIASRFTADKPVTDTLNLISLKRRIETKLKKLAAYNDHYLRFDEFATRLAETIAQHYKITRSIVMDEAKLLSIFAEYPEIISRHGTIVHKKLFNEISSLFTEHTGTLRHFVTSRECLNEKSENESKYFVELPSISYTQKLTGMRYENHNELEKFAHTFAGSLHSEAYSAELIGTDDLYGRQFGTIWWKLKEIDETISKYCEPHFSTYYRGLKIVHCIKATMIGKSGEVSTVAFKKAFMENCHKFGFILPDSEYGKAMLPLTEELLEQMLATVEKLQSLLLSSDNPEFLEWLCMQNSISKTQLKTRMKELSQKEAT